MTDNGRNTAQSRQPRIVPPEPSSDPNRSDALNYIQDQYKYGRSLSQDAKGIGCPGVAAAMLTNVNPFQDFGKQYAKAYRTE